MKEIELDLTQPEIVLDITEDTVAKGLFIGRGDDSLTSKITITHSKPHLQSRITIKSVVFDNAKVDLEGMLVINKGAIETDTYLKLDCLVIGENASARAVPSLEIYEDNVAGGHGATIGYVDPEMISYLQSKGINAQGAEDLLVEAFINN
jgi:Fe-S cluster assembly protein SufD